MTTITSDFERLATAVCERAAEVLCAPVSVIDERGLVIAASDRDALGLRIDPAGAGSDEIRAPIRLDGRAAEVVVGAAANGEPVSPRLARELLHLVITQAEVVATLPNHHLWKNKFIHDLLRGPAADEASLLREGQILGMDLRRPRAVILINAASYIQPEDTVEWSERHEARVPRRAQIVIASIVSFFSLPNDTICAYIGDGEVAVLKASSTQDLAAWTDGGTGAEPANASWANLTALKRAAGDLLRCLRRDTGAAVSIGIGRYHPGIRGLQRSYDDARAALSLGRRFHGENRVHCLDGLGIAAFVGIADERTKVDLATHLLSPLDHEPELLQTLNTYFAENCCPSDTGAGLGIHRNTLAYRLNKIASLTGLDPRRFDDAVQIRLALLVRSLQPEQH